MHQQGPSGDRSLVTNRTMDVIVALLLLAISAVVLTDSLRIGIAWQSNEGPASGYFPFRIALIMAIASLINLVSAALGRTSDGSSTFVSAQAFGRVLAVLVPAIIYVALVQYIGIYVASALFIFVFMMIVGRERLLRALGVGLVVPLILFFMFEIWFLVPLPKGPLETWLGY
jgi:hypothetical protein